MGVCNLTIGSLFNGISGWILAGQKYGVETLWESEVDKFCEAVTKHHFPDVVQLGDITKLDGAQLWPVDIICAGSPCQDLSVAGKQEGLKGERSGLFRDAIRLIRDMRRASGGRYPRFFVWENVPGAFSSNKGADFRAVLEEITEAEIPMPENNKWADAGMVEWDGGSLCWRVLDAQYWGVPQRRRRIFLVAYFGGHRAGEILLVEPCLSRNIAESQCPREGTPAGTESSIGGASVVRMRAGCAGGGKGALVSRERSLTLAANTNDQVLFVPDKARSLTARNDGSPCIDCGPEIVAAGFKAGAGADAGGLGYQVEQMPTLTSEESGTQRPTVAVYDISHRQDVIRPQEYGTLPFLTARAGTGGNNLPIVHYLNDQGGKVKASGGNYGGGSESLIAEKTTGNVESWRQTKTVRRLTPLEAERLQGLPDNFTLIDDKTCSDTARYKALGNGMAQPVANWVIKRIKEVVDGG